MIIRVFRMTAVPGKQQELEEGIKQLSIPLVKAQQGMVAFYSGKPFGSNTDEFVMVTVWQDLESLKTFVGEDWEQVVIPEQERSLQINNSVAHFELLGGTFAANDEFSRTTDSP